MSALSDPLSALHPKKGEGLDIVPPLRAYLEAHYAGRDAQDAASDLATISALRAEVVSGGAASSNDAKRDQLLRCAAAAGRRAPQAGAAPEESDRRPPQVLPRAAVAGGALPDIQGERERQQAGVHVARGCARESWAPAPLLSVPSPPQERRVPRVAQSHLF